MMRLDGMMVKEEKMHGEQTVIPPRVARAEAANFNRASFHQLSVGREENLIHTCHALG